MAGILSKGIIFKMGAASSSLATVANLQSVPDLLGEVDNIDVTTLADDYRHYIPGIKDVGVLDFGFLFDNGASGNFRTLKAAEGTVQYFAVEFPDGTAISWQGYVSVSIDARGVNEAVTFTAHVMVNSDMTVTNPV